MEVFRELHIQASDSEQLVVLMDDVEQTLPPDWIRVRYAEENSHQRITTSKLVFCFLYVPDKRFPSATIFLVEEAPGLLLLSNIVPRTKHELTIEESNALLEEFSERILGPCARKLGVQIGLSTGRRELSDWLTDATVAMFRQFSDTANRRAGYLLPADRKRWLEFILAAHRERSSLDPSTLRRWLVDVEGWSPEVANQLAAEYAFGGEILTFSENRLAGV